MLVQKKNQCTVMVCFKMWWKMFVKEYSVRALIHCLLLLIKKNGTVWWHVYNKSVMALVLLEHYVWIDQRYSVMALIQKVWWHLLAFKRSYSVMALVHRVLLIMKGKYSVMALVQKVWWHLFAKEVQCDGTSTLCVEKEKVQCDGTDTKMR